MAEPTAEQLLHEFMGSTSADVTMSLLRSPNAPLHLALMTAHLGEGQLVDGQSLIAAIDADLGGLLRVHRVAGEIGDDPGEPVGPKDGSALVTHWRRKRWVHRHVDAPTAVPTRHGPVDDEPQAAPVQGTAQGQFRPGAGSPGPAHHP